MAETRATNPFVEQFRLGGVPKDLRLMAAAGDLPLNTTDLVDLLQLLVRDQEPSVAQKAAATLHALPLAEFLPIAKDKTSPAGVLGWCLRYREERELREAALQNPTTPDAAVEEVAASLASELAELVVINQARLLRRTSLLVALESNASLNNDQKRRLRELRETFRIGEAVAAPEPEEPPPPPPLPEPPPDVPMTEAEAVQKYLTEEGEKAEPDKRSTLQQIYTLNTSQKILKALKGTRGERGILIKDANRLVSSAVLGSPSLTDAEVESFASMKSLSDEVLRQIGTHRDWTRKYAVAHNLVKNPRTPIAISLGMVSRLNSRDLKALSLDRNVSDVIRKQAEKFVKGPGKGA